MGCEWYERNVCGEKHCNGNGYVSCRIKESSTIYNRVYGEYRKITMRNPQMSRVHCLSFITPSLLEKSLTPQRLGL